jgi:hypothetical protein
MTQYTRNFARLVELSHTPEWAGKVWRDGGHYDRRGDFRAISGGELPVILHQGNRHDRKAGDKVELVETGPMSVLDMTATIQQLYKIDAQEQRVMRLDLAADTEDVTVSWYRNNTYARSKQTMREWAVQSISSRRAETLTAGNKPSQLRIYDKTGHRKVLLASELRKLSKEDKSLGMSFEQRWGYSPDKIVTRVERQIGGKSAIERFGYTKVGNLYSLDKADPFSQIVFPGTNVFSWPLSGVLRSLPPEQQITAEFLRKLAISDGVTNAKNHLFRMCKHRTQFYRLWKRYEQFVMPLEQQEKPATRESVHTAFLHSMSRQLKRAA